MAFSLVFEYVFVQSLTAPFCTLYFENSLNNGKKLFLTQFFMVYFQNLKKPALGLVPDPSPALIMWYKNFEVPPLKIN